jgi:HD-GYP domain-containing protein (c-di-GMP phosphodiesterase class II)
MKALVITPKNSNEYKFVSELLKKLGVGSSALSQDELEDIGMSKLLHDVDKTKKVSRSEIMKKLSA